MMIAETAPGRSFTPLGGRDRPPRDVAVHPLHRIGRGERQWAREHLVEGDAERVEIAAGVDRPVHPSGLFGRHVGERAGDDLRRLGRLRSRGRREAMPNPVSRTSPVAQITRILGGLMSLCTRPRW